LTTNLFNQYRGDRNSQAISRMGIINDYFRAENAEYALLAIASSPRSVGFDTVEAEGIDPWVMLGQLVAFIRGMDTVATRPVWPPLKTEPTSKDAYDQLPESSPWRTGPWLHELNTETRDALALVDDALLSELASQWSKIEEFRGSESGDSLLPLLIELVELARKAHKNSEPLYCLSGL
jgi:hypothetical protein